MNRGRCGLAAALGLTLLWAAAARAADKPLWGIGLGAGTLVFNDYRGADTVHAYPIPVPYITYRGKFHRSDYDGVRAT